MINEPLVARYDDTVIALFQDCGISSAFNDNTGSFASKITYRATADDSYLDLRITEFEDNYRDDEGYDITVGCIANGSVCPVDSVLVLDNNTIVTPEVYEGCNTVTAGNVSS